VLGRGRGAAANDAPKRDHLRHGGTSTECVSRRRRAGARAGTAGRRPADRLPSLDVHTIGAGGGIDRGASTLAALEHPQSAGAIPPGCYAVCEHRP